MIGPDDRDNRLVQFLLGSLPEAEHEEVEEHLFSDEQLQDELEATRDDLIHGYLAGGLSDEERGRFETHFLASDRHRERVAFIRDLVSAVGRVGSSGLAHPVRPQPRMRPRWSFPWAMAAAALLAATTAIVTLAMRTNWRASDRASVSPHPAPASDAPITVPPTPPRILAEGPRGEAPSPAASRGTASPRVRVVQLPSAEGAGPTEVHLPPGTRVVRLEASVPEGPPSYDAVVRSTGGEEIWRVEGIAPAAAGQPLLIDVPAELLTAADYVLSVEGEALRGTTPAERPLLERRLRIIRHKR